MSDLLARHNDVLAPVIGFNTDIVAASADGLWITDPEGNRWADFACGTAVSNLFHRHPAGVEAAKSQLDHLIHSGMIVRYESVVKAGEKLRDITPPNIEKFGFAT